MTDQMTPEAVPAATPDPAPVVSATFQPEGAVEAPSELASPEAPTTDPVEDAKSALDAAFADAAELVKEDVSLLVEHSRYVTHELHTGAVRFEQHLR